MLIFKAPKIEYKGCLHLHTDQSDGLLPPLEAVQAYEAAGYDFIAITDHRRITLADGYTGPMLVLPGIEINQAKEEEEVIHIVAIGTDAAMLRSPDDQAPIARRLEHFINHGAACFLAHPHWSLNRVETIKALRGLHGAEIYNAVSCPPTNPDRADSTHILDLLARDGLLLPTIAADDAHYYAGEFADSFIYAQADNLSTDAILTALKSGRFYASRGPRFHEVSLTEGQVRVSCSPVDHITFHSNLAWNEGRAVNGSGITRGSYRLASGERFVRVVLTDSQGRKAWLNPFPIASLT